MTRSASVGMLRPMSDRLENFGVYRLARQLFDDFWVDSEILGKDYRGRELVKQQVRSLDSVCANMEEGYGRGFSKELPQSLKVSRGEARESRGRYERCRHLLSAETYKDNMGWSDWEEFHRLTPNDKTNLQEQK